MANSRNGVFCEHHEAQFEHKCRIRGCPNFKAEGSQACIAHQSRWHSHVVRFGRQSILGIRRLLRRSEEEQLDWLPVQQSNTQQHDAEPASRTGRQNYFTASRFYCVETICAPCGVVIAWTKFAKAESPTNILNFLQTVYPTEDVRPDYICIDKACMVLRTAISNGSWEMWQKTTRFIVDSYHYINHRTTDYLCRKWCNPAPLNGSAPNLVAVENDKHGNPHYKRAFNTQACEQLNAWLGGFQAVLNRMNAGNFDWFLHTMLFLHTERVIRKQQQKQRDSQSEDEEEEEEEEDVGIEVDRDV